MKVTHQPTHVPGYAAAVTISVKDDAGKEIELFNAVDTPAGLQRIDNLCKAVGDPVKGDDLNARVQALGEFAGDSCLKTDDSATLSSLAGSERAL